MENNYNRFRRAAIGGFNRQDVIEYIEKMKNEFFDYKKEVEKTVSQLNEKISELEKLSQAKETDFAENTETVQDVSSDGESDAVSDINEATLKLRMVADELCKSLSDFMERVSENAVSVVIEKVKDEAEEIHVEETDKQTDSDFAEESSEETVEQVIEEIMEELKQEEGEGKVSTSEEISKEDKVSSILKSTVSFCFTDEKTEDTYHESAEQENEKRNILDILDAASFIS